jgi:hypothetical protein
MQQLTFSFDHDRDSLRSYIEKASDKTVSLVITDNSCSVFSMKEEQRYISLRLHNIFLFAGADVLSEIACYIKNCRIKTPLIRNFINQHSHLLHNKTSKKVNIRPQGRYYNLLDSFKSINKEYFKGRVTASITWGTKSPRRMVKERTLGSYSGHNHMIRINPALDKKRVPRYYLDFIVFHEMLHADMETKEEAGKRYEHSKEFKRREKKFKYYRRALAWEKKY